MTDPIRSKPYDSSMRVVHIADPHLGYRAYNRVTRAGVNAREADVFDAFRRTLAKIVEIQPDLILIAGDLFHVVRPSNLTIQHTFREFALLRQKTQAPVIIIGGNHDSPRSADTGCILDLFTNIPGIHVAHTEYVQVSLKNLNTSVFCLCHRALPHLPSLKIEPDPSSKYNILLAHGTVEGTVRYAYDIYEISRSQAISDIWDYIAFGHHHIFEQLAPNAFYAGSLEYTSTNIWTETEKPKGFIEYDLDERRLISFHKIATRDVIDLRPIDAAELDASELNRVIEQRLATIDGSHKNKIVRLVVENVHRSVQADLDYSAIRQVRAEAMHFELQLRPPDKRLRKTGLSDTGPSRPLEEEWEEFAHEYPLDPAVDRDHLIALGRDYLMRQTLSE
ncbi:MAG: exonuclease SbcCD subunit D [Armatimonadetes bacterium]|nr:exonuclease SbcCD subunit D [Armatimonadota bacterium]